jgi:hypothetical protein
MCRNQWGLDDRFELLEVWAMSLNAFSIFILIRCFRLGLEKLFETY